MGQTITEKIFSEHVGKEVFAGEIVRSPIDMVIGNDITTPISIKALINPSGVISASPLTLLVLTVSPSSNASARSKIR